MKRNFLQSLSIIPFIFLLGCKHDLGVVSDIELVAPSNGFTAFIQPSDVPLSWRGTQNSFRVVISIVAADGEMEDVHEINKYDYEKGIFTALFTWEDHQKLIKDNGWDKNPNSVAHFQDYRWRVVGEADGRTYESETWVFGFKL